MRCVYFLHTFRLKALFFLLFYLTNILHIIYKRKTVFDIRNIARIPKTEKTYQELEREFAPYARFHAFKNHRIYGCNSNYIPFYEESPFHPELLLKDVVKILHPDLLEGYTPRYFSKLALD